MSDENKLEIQCDGGFTNAEACNYMEECKAGAINLNLYEIGNYSFCHECKYQERCLNSARIAGEQAEL